MNRKAACAALALLLLTLMLSGCSDASQLNDQAYAVTLAVDRTEQGEILLSVQVPNIGQSSSSGVQEDTQQAGYVLSTAAGATFAEALDLLEITLPKMLNLSQLKTIVFSQEVAMRDDFGYMLQDMMMTYRLYSAASVVVCLGNAHDFLAEQKPSIGSRLSTYMVSILGHYQAEGHVPVATLADVYYGMQSFYSDPVAILAATADDTQIRPIPAGRPGDALPGTLPRTGFQENEYMGCALFNHRQMVGFFGGMHTQMMNVLRGDIAQFSYVCEGLFVHLGQMRPPKVSIDLSEDVPKVHVLLQLSVMPLERNPDTVKLEELLRADMMDTIEDCQSLKIEPFLFAEVAARQFLTTYEWQQYGWSEKFAQAEITLDFRITQLDP